METSASPKDIDPPRPVQASRHKTWPESAGVQPIGGTTPFRCPLVGARGPKSSAKRGLRRNSRGRTQPPTRILVALVEFPRGSQSQARAPAQNLPPATVPVTLETAMANSLGFATQRR